MPLTIATPMTTANAVSSARILRPARPLSATAIIAPVTCSSVSRISWALDGPRSRTMSPSARNSTRSAIAAACASWVTITVVWPSVSTESRSSARISPLVVESRLPVGSSANITLGRETSARATATRCCWPPESSDGRCARRSVRPTVSISSSSHAGSGLPPASLSGSAMFSAAVSIGSRLKNWKMKPMWSRRSSVSAASSRPVMSTPATVTSPEVGCVEAGEDVHERRLARARRAHHGRQAAAGDVDRDAAQGVDRGIAGAVAADEVAGADDGGGAIAGGAESRMTADCMEVAPGWGTARRSQPGARADRRSAGVSEVPQ